METQLTTYIFGAAVLTVAAAALLFSVFLTVQQRTTAIVQRLGKFMREVPRSSGNTGRADASGPTREARHE